VSAVAELAPATVRLEARGLAHRYGARQGLAPLDFDIDGPGLTAFTGPNGSGKSTLMRILAGLLRPSAGIARLAVGGRKLEPGEHRLHVGLASPGVAFYDELTARENLAFAAEARGLGAPAERVREALERVGLGDRADDRVAALSSGMVQRLRIACALLHAPPVLLLDEPGNHLDAAGRAVVEGLLDRARGSVLVLIATNDEREWRHADQRIELGGGRVGRPA
jgi:heme exporter protein A